MSGKMQVRLVFGEELIIRWLFVECGALMGKMQRIKAGFREEVTFRTSEAG